MISPYLNKPLRSLQQVMSEQPAATRAARPGGAEQPGLSEETAEEDGTSVLRRIDG
ncbi:MAG: hypothetical protein BroJett029_07960 [Alphaproteobacteria bacterium]|nr:MAG: hypothetical protein BroJett029_07960 [Alphaproteobacteria bacterium]